MKPVGLTLALTLFASLAFAQSDPVSRSWNQPVEPFRITGNLYYVGASDITSYLFTTPAGHIVLDGGFVETAPMIAANIERLGFRVEDVRILIGSHPHSDHAGGLAELKRRTGARFLASNEDAPLYARGGREDPQFGDRFPFPPIHADRMLSDGEQVTLGSTSLTARITPGHTPGCTTWTTTIDDYEVAFLCSPTAPGYVLAGNPRYPNAIADYRKQFATLRSLSPDIFLASHGNFFDLEAKRKRHDATTNAFVDPEGYRSFVAATEKRFEQEAARQSIAAYGLVVRNATVIDGTGAAPRPHMDVHVRGESIVDVVPAGTRAIPAGAQVLDATDQYVIPGLIDMHAHLILHPWNEQGEIAPRYDRQSALEHLRLFLRFGVTAVRDPGAETADALLLRNLVRSKTILGPQIFTAGRILTYGENNPEPFVTVRDEAAVRDEIRWQANAGVDAIKVYSSLPPDLVRVAIDEAHARGLPILGHLQRTTWTEAARMGIDGIEHAAPWSSEYLPEAKRGAYGGGLFDRVYWLDHASEPALDAMIAALVENKVVVDPTLMAMHTKFWGDDPRHTKNPELALLPDVVRKGWPAGRFTRSWTPAQYLDAQRVWPRLLRLTKKMHDAGVHLVTGTDTPTPWIIPGASLHDELQLFEDAGIPPLSILRMATFDAARALRREKELGSIAPGLRADLIVLSKNPLLGIRNTRAIEAVVHGGRLLDR